MTIPSIDPLRRVCVFCGSSTGIGDEYVEAAVELGQLLAKRGMGLVYGGARAGIMGVLADAALDAGGEVYGVIPESLLRREIGHTELTELHVVADMHQRKAKMAELADGFIALPGGAGTLEELFEVWTWAQLGLHEKPIGLVDVGGYFQPLLRFAEHMVEQGFLRPEYRDMIAVAPNSAALLDRLADYLPPQRKWDTSPTTADESIVDVLAWVHVRDGRLLSVRSNGKDAFYLPGGKREVGESDVRALSREVYEELGVVLDERSISLFDVVTDIAHGFADGRKVRMICYLADGAGEPTASGEIAELAWMSPDDADHCAPAVRQVLRRIMVERGML